MEKNKRKTRPPTKQVKITYPIDEHDILAELAESKGITIAEMFRQSMGVVLDDKRKRAEKKHVIEIKVDKDWKFQVTKLGHNLNTALKNMYIYKSPIHLRALQQILNGVEEIDRKVTEYVESQK